MDFWERFLEYLDHVDTNQLVQSSMEAISEISGPTGGGTNDLFSVFN